MILKIKHHKNKFFILILFFFSIIINQYYGNLGVFPLDSFLHFDNGYRILNGENHFKDFWVVSGPAVDYIQAFFFYIFGINWSSYVFHASLMNGILTVATFFVLKNFKLKNYYCFLYALLFSILAYPSSGTPFVDHHATFFSLLGLYCFIFAVDKKKKIYWLLVPFFLGLAFLSKQVPSSYVIIFISLLTIIFSLKNHTLNYLKYFLISSFLFIILVFVFGNSQEIKLSSFLDQYIFYPQSIGIQRYENLNYSFSGFFNHFKFIYLFIFFIVFFYYKNVSKNNKYIKSKDSYALISFLLFTFSLLIHQLLTNNQTFIFFLIPLLAAFSHIALNTINLLYKKSILVILISVCLFSVAKYHIIFNENRKFHELNNVNFKLAISATKIDTKLSGLNWITKAFKEKPTVEINNINKIKDHLKMDKRNKMLLTKYSFFSVILDEQLFSPSWAFTDNGTTYPTKDSKYAENYKSLLIKIIKKNKIKVIYIAGNLTNEHIYNYIDEKCFEKKDIFNSLVSYEIKKCDQIKG